MAKIGLAIYIISANGGLFTKTYHGEGAKEKALENFEIAKKHPSVKDLVLNEIAMVDGKQIVNPLQTFVNDIDYAEPKDGGCWFCYQLGGDDITYDSEFDTYLHISCLKKELKENPDNPEAKIMKYLLDKE